MVTILNGEDKAALEWKRFSSMGEAIRSESGKKLTPVVYAITDSDRNILYLGMTTNIRGLYERYQGNDKAVDAAMDGSRKYVFIAHCPMNVKDVEKQLIFQEKPKYNKLGKQNKPEKEILMEHKGDIPRFKL